ncbi:trehalose 6-phosphate synthase/phosphatase [Thermodesulfitimonas autotrophica]|uniref:Alpha,alpha-trehalose-phosphate synthase n=1 Tax=Thermodesulfitimonas autotrophica TaxID=1894989 RepID=A0A3N5BZV6_9THEO|nr:bifunctional alpha,alpha-trehalose-phosphate synthase (UDP-forming)/trehalose-phosphatase [Thermodesulfitimonas autotrophica]RPF49411.1 trehalose 6-phosphate synthase/phosphatase [Thermodesulfitimonas autotrophica]
MGRLLIVSNRLPVTVLQKKGGYRFFPSIGGLATGLKSLQRSWESLWIGWPGEIQDEEARAELRARLLTEFNCHPVFLSPADVEKYYGGFSNRTIWPLFHYFPVYTVYDESYWEAYERVNRLFCREILRVARPDDTIWVHDYHLMLLPKMLREKLPDAAIGFFLHIPFPSFELFRLLPWRRDILEGLLGADLVGFHTYDYARHFLSSVLHILGYDHKLGEIITREHAAKVDSFPMGIDYERFSGATALPAVRREIRLLRQQLGDTKVVLSIDRLDYTKGIPQRLEAFSLFLKKYPEWRGKVTLLLVTAPSRVSLDQYRLLRRQVDELVGRINGEYGSVGWTPIRYLNRTLTFHPLAAMYAVADVALVTPLRDGMNLIAKEYIATRRDGKGVLIISEMAGAASELGEALVINPNNKAEVAEALHLALQMPEEEQVARNRVMQERLKRWNVACWAEKFMEKLAEVKERQEAFLVKRLRQANKERLVRDYASAKRRLLLLDYDGTLTGFFGRPEEARPGNEILELLARMAAVPGNEVVLISGRDKETLEDWFGDLGIGLIAEHGVWIKEQEKDWEMIEPLTNEWKEAIRPVLELYVDRTPGAFIEEKGFALVFHYRKAEPELGALRARELVNHLLNLTANLHLQVLEGNKVVEVKNAGINKGRAALRWIGRAAWDFILAAGDDRTDEDLFAVLPETAYSLKVGLTPSRARFNLPSPKEVLSLLEKLVDLGPRHG